MKRADLQIVDVVQDICEENAYLVFLNGNQDCLVIDPGFPPDHLIEEIRRRNLNPVAFLITHGHFDHIGGITALKNLWKDAQIIVGEQEKTKLTNDSENLSGMLGCPQTVSPADRTLSDGDNTVLADIPFQAILLPGHSSGHMIYKIPTEDIPVVFVGDVIFSGSIGRTDFPDGSFDQLLDGIYRKILTLPDNTELYSGHGPTTSVGQERKTNPFLNGLC